MRLYTINTVNNCYDIIIKPFGDAFKERHPEVEVYNLIDDSLLPDTRLAGAPTEKVIDRMVRMAQAAETSGADGVLTTCTSVVPGSYAIKEKIHIPSLNIAEPVAQMAVDNGTTIGVLGTIPTSPLAIDEMIDRYVAECGKNVTVKNAVAEGAFDVLCAGDRAKHDEMVNEAMYKLSKEVDVICFAQISMSLLKHDPMDVPVYKIGDSGYEKIYEMMKNK